MAGEIQPYFDPGQYPTGYATADVFGGRAVQVDADATDWAPEGLQATAKANVIPVEPCAAGAKMFGVAHRDVDVSEDKRDLVTIYRNAIVPAVAGAAIEPGVEVEVGTAGKFITLNTGVAVGYAVSGASGDGVKFPLAIYS